MRTTVKTATSVDFTQTFSEVEARALEALVGYGIEPFLKVFYEHMGRAYMQPHEQGLRSLFDSIGDISGALNEVDHNRRLLATALIAERADRMAKAARNVAEAKP
jgi:hypothetical protein